MAGWKAYSELAWVESVVAPPVEFKEETLFFCEMIKQNSQVEVKTLLHLASGSGINDYTFKHHFRVTGVDISEDMLAIARDLNPEVAYEKGDMRYVKLGEHFDAVAIPDAIGYMQTFEDLRQAVSNARDHLNPGGVLLVTALTKEQFQPNNFAYTGTKGDVEVTVFENNYMPADKATTYEAVMVYLVRRRGNLEIYTDRHVLGLFEMDVWLNLFKELDLQVTQSRVGRFYDRFILEEGDYPLTIFTCTKPL